MSSLPKVLLIISLAAFCIPVVLFGQHYVFIEADGQQPFYVKKSDTLYSSSASGFLIIPKVPKGDFNIVVGFPKAIYPEVSFDIKGVGQDRGFQLKQFEGKGWGLFDRTSMEVISASSGLSNPMPVDGVKKASTAFSELLSGATGEEVLLDQQPVATTKQLSVPVLVEEKGKDQSDGKLSKQKDPMPQPVKIKDFESELERTLTYIVQSAKGQIDTVNVKINKSFSTAIDLPKEPLIPDTPKLQVESVIPSQPGSAVDQSNDTSTVTMPALARQLPACKKPVAASKDMMTLQKKLLGLSKEEDQIALVERSFGLKCYTSKQAVEIASFFLDEHSRLNLYKRIYWLVTDHFDFKEAGTLFFNDENIQAFQKLHTGY